MKSSCCYPCSRILISVSSSFSPSTNVWRCPFTPTCTLVSQDLSFLFFFLPLLREPHGTRRIPRVTDTTQGWKSNAWQLSTVRRSACISLTRFSDCLMTIINLCLREHLNHLSVGHTV